MIRVDRLSEYRIRDILEQANIPRDHEEVMFQCMRSSICSWAGYVDDDLACLWGIVPPTLLSDRVYLWLVVNELVDDHKFVFIRHSQVEMKKMLDLYPTIIGHCDVRHKRSMEWLKWLGARFDLSQGPMAPFTIVREDG